MILQQSKSTSDGFSLMQLLVESSKGESDSGFALLLKQLGVNTKAIDMSAQEQDSTWINRMMSTQQKSTISLDMATLLETIDDDTDLMTRLQGGNLEDLAVSDMGAINQKIVTMYSRDEVVTMITDAKAHLQEKIVDLARRKGIDLDLKQLPKTLQSLTVIAEKIGIDLSSITLETLPSSQPNKHRVGTDIPLLQVTAKTAEHSTQELVQFKHDRTRQQSRPPVVDSVEASVKQEPLKKLLHVNNPQVEHSKVAPQQIDTAVAKQSISTELAAVEPRQSSTLATVAPSTPSSFIEDMPSVNELRRTSTSTHTPTADADIMAKLHTTLIRDESLTAITTDEPKHETKIASVTQVEAKGVELEIKVKEAKQTVAHFATTLKEAVENYKPPFTRIAMQLNPANLGEVDVTMIQRGNNVHISINSNNSAIALLAQHSVELKQQLANNGLGGATMQFNTGGGEQQRQSQHHFNMMEAYEKYASTESDESFETITSLELIVPRYV